MAAPKNLIQILITAKNLSSKEFRGATRDVEDFKDTLKKTSAVALAAGAAIAGSLLHITMRTAKTVDEFAKFERATGVQANTLAALRFAIQRWGGTQRDADTSLRRFTKAVADAASGLDSYVRVFKRLGITQDELVGPDGTLVEINKLLPIVADRFRLIEDATLKADTAQILWGRGGLRIVPLMNQGAAGMARMADRAERLGILFGRKMLKDAENFQDAMLDMRQSLEGLSFAIGAVLMPILSRYTFTIVEHVVKAREWTEANKNLTLSVAGLSAGLMAAGGLGTAVVAITGSFKLFRLALGGMAGPISITIALLSLLAGAFFTAKLRQEEQISTIGGVEAALKSNLERLEELEKKYKQVADEIGNTSLFTGEAITEEDVEDALSGIQEDMRKILEDNAKLLKLRKAMLSTEDEEALAMERKAEMERMRLERIKEMERALARGDIQFQFRRETGEASIADEIVRQEETIRELNEQLKHEIELTKQVTGNLELYEMRLETAMKTSDEYWAAKLRLVEILEEEGEEVRGRSAEWREYRDAVAAAAASEEQQRADQEAAMQRQSENWRAYVKASRIASTAVAAGFQSAFAAMFREGNKLKDSWKAFWKAMAQTVASAMAQIIASIIKVRIIEGVMKSIFGIVPIVGPMLGPILPAGATLGAASGGEIMRGSRQQDSTIVAGTRGENILDRHSNDRLKDFLDDVEDGAFGGGGNINFNVGLYAGSQQENLVMANMLRRSDDAFVRTHIGRGRR